MSVSTSRIVTCCEMADLSAILYLMFSCAFVTFPLGVLGQVRVLDCIDSWPRGYKTGEQFQTQNIAQ